VIRVLADEGVERRIVAALGSIGLDVIQVSGPYKGMEDADVLRWARSERRLLLTRDKDFGTLVIKEAAECHGVVLYRLRALTTPERIVRLLDVFLRADESWHEAFIVVGPESVRYRRLPAK
jgi:predicted nuclease of predicted toxin-antitoxin system